VRVHFPGKASAKRWVGCNRPLFLKPVAVVDTFRDTRQQHRLAQTLWCTLTTTIDMAISGRVLTSPWHLRRTGFEIRQYARTLEGCSVLSDSSADRTASLGRCRSRPVGFSDRWRPVSLNLRGNIRNGLWLAWLASGAHHLTASAHIGQVIQVRRSSRLTLPPFGQFDLLPCSLKCR